MIRTDNLHSGGHSDRELSVLAHRVSEFCSEALPRESSQEGFSNAKPLMSSDNSQIKGIVFIHIILFCFFSSNSHEPHVVARRTSSISKTFYPSTQTVVRLAPTNEKY